MVKQIFSDRELAAIYDLNRRAVGSSADRKTDARIKEAILRAEAQARAGRDGYSTPMLRRPAPSGQSAAMRAMRQADETLFTPAARRVQNMVQDAGEPFGLGGGYTQQIFDATSGGIRGNVNCLLQASENIATGQTTTTIDASTAFTANDQSRVGSVGRLLEQLQIDVSVDGTFPSGYDAQSLRQYLLGITYLQPEIGGVPQTQIPVGLMVRTDFLRTLFGFRAILDPGNFSALSFNWNSDSIVPPAPASASWNARLNIVAVFSAPASLR